ncbi:hypothetical protein MO867_21600 [Microbulbifer sp. OS29]|uniref:BIG2 domain-containing protein n=1 Tax=Microbulbifer okhotskensis TaxID=2926617 RepID=A0A9X2ESD6_9GAMM|nr:hypothetical protein [Microbulbifer okhotskensis]MCO1336926.1 hypothetical protein [Microbulbifer okhotskensis]
MNGITGQYQSWRLHLLHILRFGILTLTIGLLSACGGGGSSNNGNSGSGDGSGSGGTDIVTLESVGLEQDSSNEYQYFLTAYYSDDSSTDVTGDADWSVSDTSLATIDAGLLTPRKVGSLTLSATYEGMSAEEYIELPLLIESLEVSRDTSNFDQYYLTAHYNDDMSKDVTEEAEWSISDTRLATVEAGLITALESGSATLTASFDGETAETDIEHLVYVREIFATSFKFAALKNNGSVVSWPNDNFWGIGVKFSDVSANLTGDVVEIFATEGAFAALKSDGSVIVWGEPDYGGNSSSVSTRLEDNVVNIYPNKRAFSALKSDGSIVTWGDSSQGGDSSDVSAQLASEVEEVYATKEAFVARKSDGSLVTWGHSWFGGDSSAVSAEISSEVMTVFSSWFAFAALKLDGSVVTWGKTDSSAVNAEISSDVETVFSTKGSFAALKSDGSVVAWGGVDSAEISSDVVEVFTSLEAFASLESDGSVVTWGSANYGGDSSAVSGQLVGGVDTITPASRAFAAVKSDGSVVTWGHADYGGDSSEVESELTGNVEAVYSLAEGFAALTTSGSLITWGRSSTDSSSVSDQLASGVLTVFALMEDHTIFIPRRGDGAFVVLKDDKSVVTWGDELNGGDSSDIDFY